jgi:uncharacterized membrane protein YqjE
MDPAPNAETETAAPETAPPSPLSSLRALLGVLFESAQTRVELLLVELQEALESLLSLLWWALIALIASGVALIVGALTVIFIFWDTHRMLAALLVTAALFALAVGAALVARSRVRGSHALFAATLEEIAKDQEQFGRRR